MKNYELVFNYLDKEYREIGIVPSEIDVSANLAMSYPQVYKAFDKLKKLGWIRKTINTHGWVLLR